MVLILFQKSIHLDLEKLIKENKILTKKLGAKAIQGKGYLPGSDEPDIQK